VEDKTKLEKAYDKNTRVKKDIQNKLVRKITEQFSTICYQDDSIKGGSEYGENES